ncbi:hypothetical protein NLJ89_g1824 [Agrocybe chaxingu]|uniref:Uncharacterized protein n=1 Tax=Agrocybe chaxingu TaxID=84603 RepID=A0A9W8MZA9_9AGAR|nr:hypothetical protein NLJ89_g1824 [Agrocybe chaxingu]
MSDAWSPKRTLTEVDAILCAPGTMHETQTVLVGNLVQRVYKNLWPSLRVFWLWAAKEHKDAVYAVFENQRLTFAEAFQRSLRAAAIYHDVYGVRKGDRVVICARNYPEYIVAFWACHLLGAISALANAWSPLETLRYCIAHTECKLIIVDPERANLLEPISRKLVAEAGSTGILVLESQEGKGKWEGMTTWHAALNDYRGDPLKILTMDPKITPEDDATILFTSGTTGMPKADTSRLTLWLTLHEVTVGTRRAALRRGEGIPTPPVGPQKAILLSVPLFHVTGLTSLTMLATMGGLKIVMMRKWIPEEGARLMKKENVVIAGGVPSMVSDLADSSAAGLPLDALMFGGAPAPDTLTPRARKAFPTATMSQGYGLTETSSVAVGFAGEDYVTRPTSWFVPSSTAGDHPLIVLSGLAMPINNLMIMNGNTSVPAGTIGEVWIRGPNVMKGYWRDQAATDKVLTQDGWFKSGDLGFLDKEGFLYIRDRIKDIIIRGGENIDSVTVENALYADERVLEAAAVGVPDKRLSELVAAVVSVKPPFHSRVRERELISLARKSLPKFAVPVMIVVQNEPFERTPSGKILKADLRKLAAKEWSSRSSHDRSSKL